MKPINPEIKFLKFLLETNPERKEIIEAFNTSKNYNDNFDLAYSERDYFELGMQFMSNYYIDKFKNLEIEEKTNTTNSKGFKEESIDLKG